MRLPLFSSLLLHCIIAFGQGGNHLGQAREAFAAGELIAAQKSIDLAIVENASMSLAETWYYRGAIYAALDTAYGASNAFDIAIESFRKALDMDPDQLASAEIVASYFSDEDPQINYYAYYYEKAVNAYQSDDYSTSANYFDRAGQIMPTDTMSVLNAAYASMAAGEDQRALGYLVDAVEAGARERSIYLQLYNYAVTDQDLDRALTIIRDARAHYPEDLELMKFEIDILIDQGKVSEAKAGLEAALQKDPTNPHLYFSLGVIADEEGQQDQAIAYYERAIENDPNHYNSLFNLGAVHFNEANGLMRRREEVDPSRESEIATIDKAIKAQLRLSRPFFEQLYTLDSQNLQILQILEYIYEKLEMDEKAAQIANEIKSLR